MAATEVLEHVDEPERAVAEMARVAARWLLVSVPHEPLWRALNMARGAYLRELGNTPGHVNHWNRRSFVKLLARHGDVVQTRAPFPWTMLLVRVGCGRPRMSSAATIVPGQPPADDEGGAPEGEQGSFASGARILSIGIASTGCLHVRLPGDGQPRPLARGLQPHLPAAGRSCS